MVICKGEFVQILVEAIEQYRVQHFILGHRNQAVPRYSCIDYTSGFEIQNNIQGKLELQVYQS